MHAIDMIPVKAAMLAEHHDDEVQAVFNAALVERMNDRLAPVGVAMCYTLFVHDVATGKSGFSNKPLPPKLIGYPPIMYALLGMAAKQSLLGALPNDDARAQVNEAFEKISASA